MNYINKNTFENRLNEQLEEIKNLIDKRVFDKQTQPPVNSADIDLLKKKVAELEAKLASFKPVDPDIDLTKEFADIIAMVDDLELDKPQPAPTAEILNKVFKTKGANKNSQAKDLVIQNPTFWNTYVIDPDRDLSLKEWITQPTCNIPKGKTETVNNEFDTANPVEKDVVLGTGTGKTTLFARCFAFRQLSNEEITAIPEKERKAKVGLTIVVPFSSLVGSAQSAHNEWLNDEKDAVVKYNDAMVNYEKTKNTEMGEKWLQKASAFERVFKCPICEKKHTEIDGKPYGIDYNSAGFLNIYTATQFLDTYVNRTNEINSWVLFDEGHEDTPIYNSIMMGLMGGDGKTYHNKIKPFKIVRMSATFGDKPISKKLDGVMSDYYTTDFVKAEERHPDLFKRKAIAFIDKPDVDELGNKIVWEKKDIVNKGDKVFDKIDLTLLKKSTKVLVLNDSIKDYATDIVQALDEPLTVIASRDYSVGFSFGDVIVYMTGFSTRRIVVENTNTKKWEYKTVVGGMTLPDFIQGRGRGARTKFMTSVCLFLMNEFYKLYKNELRKDITSEALLKEFAKKSLADMDKAIIKKIVDFYNKPQEIPPISDEDGTRFLNLILTKELRNGMNSKLWKVSQEEKDKVAEEKKKYMKRSQNAVNAKKLDVAKSLLKRADEVRERKPGEFKLTSELLRFFKPELLPKVIKKANVERIARYNTEDLNEPYVFTNKNDAVIVGWLLQCQDPKNYEVEIKNDDLSIQFKPYKVEKISIEKVKFE